MPAYQLAPVPLLSLDDAAAALVLTRDATYGAMRRLRLLYYVEHRRDGRGHMTPATYVPRETFDALVSWRWQRLKPRNGSRRGIGLTCCEHCSLRLGTADASEVGALRPVGQDPSD